MKMKDFLNQIMETTNKLQLNIDRKEHSVLLHIRGRKYAIKSITLDPFNNRWDILVLPSYFDSGKIKTVDDIHYLSARKTLMSGMDNDIEFVLVDSEKVNTYIPIGTLDVKDQTIKEAKVQGAGTTNKSILYYFK